MSDSTMKQGTKLVMDVAKLASADLTLAACDGLPATRHRFDARSLYAVEAALAAGRPLLVRGEPGTGKSQLARAAAQVLGRAFRWRVVDAHTEIADLFYMFDAVERLARAQVAGAIRVDRKALDEQGLMDMLAEENFVRPEILWWAFDWQSAEDQQARFARRCGGGLAGSDEAGAKQTRSPASTAAGAKQTKSRASTAARPAGCVVLIDEIDKADPSVPNGLLEAFGQGTFVTPGGRSISLHGGGPPPLVVITTNEERELPSAFVRRCMVLQIQLPTRDDELRTWLVERGRTHFVGGDRPVSEELLGRAAALVIEDRKAAERLGLVAPGQAEYLDLLRAVQAARTTNKDRLKMLETIAEFALKKHPDLRRVEGAKAPA